MLKYLEYVTILNDDTTREQAFEIFQSTEMYDEKSEYAITIEQDVQGFVLYKIIH